MMRDIIKEPQRCQMALCRGNPSGGRGLRSHCFVAKPSTMSRIASASRLACERRSFSHRRQSVVRNIDCPAHATSIAVGTMVTHRPPHRSVRALLTHTAPTLDSWRQNAGWDKDAGSSHLESTQQTSAGTEPS